MNRKEFLKKTLIGAASVVAATSVVNSLTSCCKQTQPVPVTQMPELKLAFQEWVIHGATLTEKLDIMESLGIVGLELSGRGLSDRVGEINQALANRKVKVAAICAGFDGFILAEDAAEKAKFDSSMRDIIAAAGAIGSTGVIMVPAFNGQKPCKPHTLETREFLCEQMHELGEYALKHNTTVILEPLNRGEAYYLRQVADAAAICRDSKSDGVKCMGDFWHMQEETSDYSALIAAGKKYLQHVHVASRATRNMPGEDGDVDNYVDGLRALKELNYPYYVSFECGSKGDKSVTIPQAVELLRSQWQKA